MSKLMHLIWRFTRPMTLGVRGICLNDQNEVFLIRHSYVQGWHLPGGGVETGETLEEALGKELREEGNIILTNTPQLFAVYLNIKASKRDHVFVYVVKNFTQAGFPKPNMEIIEHGWFALDKIPETTTHSTKLRLHEALYNKKPQPHW
jgi:ADP-ribose pyrophosphatase YjhB (NUDIX family)